MQSQHKNHQSIKISNQQPLSNDQILQMLKRSQYTKLTAYLKQYKKQIQDKQPQSSQLNLKVIIEAVHTHIKDKILTNEEWDIQQILELSFFLFTARYCDHQDLDLLNEILKYAVQAGDIKYLFILYQLKVNECDDESIQLKWLLGLFNFSGYFIEASNQNTFADYLMLLEKCQQLFNKQSATKIDLVKQNNFENDQDQIQLTNLSSLYCNYFIKNLVDSIITSLQGSSWQTNQKINQIISSTIPPTLKLHQGNQLRQQLQRLVIGLQFKNWFCYSVINLPPAIYLYILQEILLLFYNMNNNAGILFIDKALQILLPKSPTGLSLSQLNQKQQKTIQKYIYTYLNLLNSRECIHNLKFNFLYHQQVVSCDLRSTFRLLIIYMGFLSPVHNQALYSEINQKVVSPTNLSILNRLRIWQFCLDYAIEHQTNQEPIQYRTFLLHNYRKCFMEIRSKTDLSQQQILPVVKLTQHIIIKEISKSEQTKNTNHVGHIISFIMNFKTILDSLKIGAQQIYEKQKILRQIWLQSNKITVLLARLEHECKGQKEQDQVELCRMRMDELSKMMKINTK